MSNRRDFLKTLGKLTAAIGITAGAASCGGHHHHDPHRHPPKHPKHPKHPLNAASLEATSNPTMGTTRKPSFPDVLDNPKYKFGFTGFKNAPNSMLEVNDVTKQAQDAISRIENLRLDNLRMRIDPPYFLDDPGQFISPHLQHTPFAESVRISRQQMLLKELDPYNWGEVFDLSWDDWKTRDPRHYTVEGCWTARVKARYRDLFGDVGVYRQSCAVPKDAIWHHSQNKADELCLLDFHKDRAYDEIVTEIKKAIQWFVDNRKGRSFEDLKALPRPDLT